MPIGILKGHRSLCQTVHSAVIVPCTREGGGSSMDAKPISRRDAGKLAAATTGATVAAWVMPEILTAKSAGGATLSTPADQLNGPSASEIPSSPAPPTPANKLAFTGLNIQLDAEVGAALIAGGWAMHHWAARKLPTPTEEV